ncbi:Transposase, MuDR, plant [Corchorus capsularis]|uniref:Transposase, MuDR, plant n=1 Tax=Corchorus capsularis TaxID=210143 RepID=A0A1R3I7A4_COCAP|nr:Transposase, MuDR, plant [Corchorus capsularis]
MVKNELAIGQSQDFSLRQNQYVAIGHNADCVLGRNHDLLRSEQIRDYDLAHNHVLGSGNTLEHELASCETHSNNLALQHDDLHNFEENGLDMDQMNYPDAEEDQHADVKEHDDQFRVAAQNHEFGLCDNSELTLVENQENLISEMEQNQEMSIVPASDIYSQQQAVVVAAPVLQYRPLAPVPNHQLTVGQEFPDVHSCRRALRDAAIANRFEIQTVKSDKTRFTAKCASEGCPWRIHAAKQPGVPTFTIRTIHDEHACGGITHLGHSQASVQWVADAVAERLKENPQCRPKDILEEIHRVHGITLSYKQAWRGKERIMAAVRGSFEEDYRLLPQYCDMIRRTNPGSIALVYTNPTDNCFQRLFISYQASIYGFLNACRPLIGLDKTVLKSKYMGTLLFACGFDGDGAVFPLAFGVVDEENDSNWMWFLSELHYLLEINVENMPKLTILSDRQKGVVEAVEANFPTAFHGFCMRHLIDNFQKEFDSTTLINLFWEAATALTGLDFEKKIFEIQEVSPEAANWIRKIPNQFWATAYFEGTRLGHLTANIVECLNSWISEASGLPIIQMMECIRRQLMTCFNERREKSMQWTGILVPAAQSLVSGAIELGYTYQVLKSDEALFEVQTETEGAFVVDIRARNCYCRGWQLHGLPCAHAAVALNSCGQNAFRFAEGCFTVASYRKAYSQTIHPVPDKALWKEMSEQYPNEGDIENKDTEVVIKPPKSLQPPGKPRKRRAPSDKGGRVKRVVHCSRCNQTGHFRSTCTAPI